MIIINNNKKRKLAKLSNFCPGWLQNKIERKGKKDKYFDFAGGIEKPMEH